jgi:hypothetical protein
VAGEVFISYRRADAAWARLLYKQLKAEGVEAWYDAHVSAGEDWRIATATALKASQIFVLLFSSNAAKSSDIAKELAAAVFEKKLVIPVRLEDIAPDGAFLYELASRNWVNAYEDTESKLARWEPDWQRGHQPAVIGQRFQRDGLRPGPDFRAFPPTPPEIPSQPCQQEELPLGWRQPSPSADSTCIHPIL